MVVQPAPSAPFIMAQAEFLLQVLIITLDAPAQFGGIDQPRKAGIGRQGGQPVFGWFRLLGGPFHQQPFFVRLFGLGHRAKPQTCEARGEGLAIFTPGDHLPSFGRLAEGQVLG